MKIAISAIMDSNTAARMLFNDLWSNGVDGLGICDGSKVIAEVEISAATITAAYFFDYLNNLDELARKWKVGEA